MTDSNQARINMVKNQIMTNKVYDAAVLKAMSSVRRELFVPEIFSGVAYLDDDLQIAEGRYLSEPMIIARLIQLAEIKPGDKVLDVAVGTAYSSAVIAEMGAKVYAIEEDEELYKAAQEAIAKCDHINVHLKNTNHSHGLSKNAPYDVITIFGRVDIIPQALLDQLAENGRLVTVLTRGGVGRATIFRKLVTGVSSTEYFDANICPLPGFEKPKEFVF